MNIKELFKLFSKGSKDSGLAKNATITFTEKDSFAEKQTKVKSVSEDIIPTPKDQDIAVSASKENNPVSKQPETGELIKAQTQDSPVLKGEKTLSQIQSDITCSIDEENFCDEQPNLVYTINKDELSSLSKSNDTMITVGLDFGTHQTKVCIESKGGVQLDYLFMKFGGYGNRMYYTFPSIIGVGRDGILTYGFLPKNYDGEVIKYFKQAAFRSVSPNKKMSQEQAYYYSIWYISYILFDLEEIFGQNFTIQMGAPTDSIHINLVKQIATRIIASSYKLVEEVFENNKKKFLETDIKTLKELTEVVAYSDDIKEEYGLLVFPEAYACLLPLISQKKIATGMNLMIDIGGGTTDISFFTIENEGKNANGRPKPQVYDFYSINKGLNYLTCAEDKDETILNSNVKDETEIDKERRKFFIEEIKRICNNIQNKLASEFKLQTTLNTGRLFEALKNRPLVYCGGGSTFTALRVGYAGFVDKKQISEKEWDVKSIPQFSEIKSKALFPILSTSYGLAISAENDDIKPKPFKDIFENIRGAMEDGNKKSSSFGEAYGGFNYADDWDAWK